MFGGVWRVSVIYGLGGSVFLLLCVSCSKLFMCVWVNIDCGYLGFLCWVGCGFVRKGEAGL